MKLHKYLSIACMVLFSFGIAGCSSDEEDKEKKVVASLPELKVKENSVRIKVGAEHRVSVDILEGGNEYNVFSTDEDIVSAEIVDKKISLEGKSVGEAVVVLSDKNSKYLKFPVSVYLTDQIKFSQEEVEMEILAGHRKSAKIKVSEGNGGYKVESGNPNIEASVTEEGEITINVTAPKEPFIGSVTVKDKGGISASFTVKVTITTEPFSEALLAEIKSEDKTRYIYDGEDLMTKHIGDPVKEYESSKFFYGWKYFEKYNFKVSFKPDLQVGKKTDATIKMLTQDMELAETAVDLEIVQNNGKKIWGIFSFQKDEMIHYGYFCDDVVNKVDIALKLDKEEVEIKDAQGESQTVEINILSGSGKYTVKSGEEEIVQASISGNVLSITGTVPEEEIDVEVTVTDVKTGKEQNVLVKLIPEENTDSDLQLEKEEIEIIGKVGIPKTVKVKILSGSGEYDAISEDESVKVSVEGNILSITGTPKEEPQETTIMVIDSQTGDEVTVNVMVIAE
ncbi:hypothetical protein [Bacteroides pyogenes]|uniref:hypothetical protein n=1 Tax=Bacteroides pyogenes TaxID=310300 RepID=UPI0011E40EBD|nr:hypothetical protein [Bacteroides pyogenes]MBR8708456.1 hypothetical protein [Bacteroides pyogenes]MBR8717074.1 hypothetical protein [Bacteroides pyogenes]MBR8724957.1 hypothetical protein [Bacteroides pyogenes]MBR8738496.1 hypothetical protein [Bacteroides pyogenes]MBR8746849.1 hypothetical protein [Bacteroides pyogenes]